MSAQMDDLELLTFQTAVLKEAKAVADAQRQTVAEQMKAGERRAAGDLGFITMTKPTPKASVVERDQLEAFLGAEGNTTTTARINDLPAALDVLAKVAPELLTVEEEVPGWAEAEALRRAEKGEAIPGVAVKPGTSALQVRPNPETSERIRELIKSGALALEARS